MSPLGDNWHPLHVPAPDDDSEQESVSMCAACGDPYTGSYDDHAASHETELPNV